MRDDVAVALPNGFVDTGITRSVPVSGSVQITVTLWDSNTPDATPPLNPGGLWIMGEFPAAFQVWRLWGIGEFDSGANYRTRIYLTGPDVEDEQGNDWVLLEFRQQQGSPPSGISGVYTYTHSTGPWRLGVRYTLIDPDPVPYPAFAQDYQLEYAWFGDRSTRLQTTFAGRSASFYLQENTGSGTWLKDQSPTEFTPRPGGQLGSLGFSGRSRGLNENVVSARFTELTVDGVTLDVSELNEEYVLGVGEAEVVIRGNTPFAAGAGATAPYRVTYDVDVTKNGGGSTRARLLDSYVVPVQLHPDMSEKQPQADYLTCPIRESYVIPITSWETHKKTAPGAWYFDVQPEWAEDQWYPWRTDDLRVALFGPPARSQSDPDEDAFPSYAPITIFLAPTVDVQRPDGRYPPTNCTVWETTDEEKITVEDPKQGANSATLIQVGATGGAVRRVFGETGTDLPVWRRWCGVGADLKEDPEFHPDRVQLTRHSELGAVNQDIFGWESYAFLRLGIDAPAAGTLTLQVEGMHLSASDPHTTGSDRFTNFVLTETPFTVTYDFDVEAGANSVEIDLLLPATGASVTPFYVGRVDALELSGFEVGDYVLTEFKLEAQGDSYFKVDWGPPVQRGDYSAMGWSNAGSFGSGGLPDQANKPEEIGKSPLAGGNLRYVYILTGSESGIIQDSQLSLGGFLGQLGAMEGWSYSYSEAAFDAANTDPYDVSLGPELAQNLNPQVPYRELTPGVGYAPPCNWTCRQMVLTNAQPYVLYTRWPLGHAGREVVVTLEDGRAPAGFGVKTYQEETGAILATGVTDGWGVAIVTPIPALGPVTI